MERAILISYANKGSRKKKTLERKSYLNIQIRSYFGFMHSTFLRDSQCLFMKATN